MKCIHLKSNRIFFFNFKCIFFSIIKQLHTYNTHMKNTPFCGLFFAIRKWKKSHKWWKHFNGTYTKTIPAHICLHCFWKFETLAAYTILTFFPARFSPPLKVQLNPTVLLLMTWILGSRLFQCQLCSRGFTGKAQLLSHFKNVHSEQIGAFSWISVKLLHFFQNSWEFFFMKDDFF